MGGRLRQRQAQARSVTVTSRKVHKRRHRHTHICKAGTGAGGFRILEFGEIAGEYVAELVIEFRMQAGGATLDPCLPCTGQAAQAWAKPGARVAPFDFFFSFLFCAPAHNCLLPLPPSAPPSACDRQTDFPWHDPPGHTAPLHSCHPCPPPSKLRTSGKEAEVLLPIPPRATKGNPGHGPEPRHSLAASSHSASPFPTEEGRSVRTRRHIQITVQHGWGQIGANETHT